MSTEEDSLLTDLCTICHIHPPKYRCPRCSTRTCSLPCSKRHKLWSQCSGVRDPAAYLRRADLATPSAFDRDFNFLTGIERGLERAERDVDRRDLAAPAVPSGVDPAVVGLDGEGEGVEGGGVKRRRVGDHAFALAKGEGAFLNNAKNAGVVVIRAPKGLSRRRENASKWNTRHKCLNWLVEWLAPCHPTDSERRKLRHVMESTALADAYNQAYPLSKEERDARAVSTDDSSVQIQQQEGEVERQDTATDTATATPTPTPTPTSAATPTAPAPTTAPAPPTTTLTPKTPTPNRKIHLYLHRPRTPTKHPVLIPLSATSSLAAALKDHTVLEFPTIYVLPYSPERLFGGGEESLPFILEEVFLRENPDLRLQLEGEVEVENGSGSGEGGEDGEVDLGNIDEGTVVEMLQKDLLVPADS
ncbi:hypothetical protein P168DRAFT_276491 [Aspergillus campestris IBT 28561]|uniref:Box C/D snoRNA protein 1 n=1 Tax=Aspergillus campestris (strain IBT 28561) TaxID=1392248 RepID=A0A2I1CR20_ASPC2|nr:uncharacterized protein P168DRAFT_276491 [Aspergillus campestris IBT 28561]PKY00065.1 hypothetical protein P168DRAFT_276491 [Aspergillus campestris IBT 28561]